MACGFSIRKAIKFFCSLGVVCMASYAGWASDEIMRKGEPILPIPYDFSAEPGKVALGKRLFHDTALSADDTVSCASCHDTKRFGVDSNRTSVGIDGQVGLVNAPTVYNSRFNFAQFWDGRARDLHDQVGGPINNPIEMGANWDLVVNNLSKEPEYVKEFTTLYGEEGITPQTISDAIRTYELTLVSVGGAFDRYLRGDEMAISAQQKRGYSLFKSYGCVACHQGVNVGGNMYQRMGAFIPYFTKDNMKSKADQGRYNVTQDKEDMFVFKVPSLRLAAYTAPYFHDGSVKTLEKAIEIMANYQLGYKVSDQDIEDIKAFIISLAGTTDKEAE